MAVKLVAVDNTVIPFSKDVQRSPVGGVKTAVGREGDINKADLTSTNSSKVSPSSSASNSVSNEVVTDQSFADGLAEYTRENATPTTRRYTGNTNAISKQGVAGADLRQERTVHKVESDTRTDPNKFNANVFKDRLLKFYNSRKKDLEKANKSGDEALKEYLKEPLNSYFMSPRVRVEAEQLYYVVKDLIEFKDVENSPAFDNLLDMKGVSLDIEVDKVERPLVNVVKEETRMEERSQDNPYFLPEKAMRKDTGESYSVTEVSTPNFDKAFGTGNALSGYTKVNGREVIPLYDSESLNLEETTILKSNVFEQCKKFDCVSYGLFSVADMGLRMGKKPTDVNSTIFKACCSKYNKEGCPQSKVYTDAERIIYDSALETSGSEEVAHNVIISVRVKNLKAGDPK